MFLFSWFGILQPRFYICLKVVRSASFVRPTTSAPSFCPRRRTASWCVEVCPSALHLRIKKFEPWCRSNEVVALRTSAPLRSKIPQPGTALRAWRRIGQRKGNGVVALRTFAFWIEEAAETRQKNKSKKKRAEALFLSVGFESTN